MLVLLSIKIKRLAELLFDLIVTGISRLWSREMMGASYNIYRVNVDCGW